jgi:hypothetical protein
MEVDAKDKEILFLRDNVYQLQMQAFVHLYGVGNLQWFVAQQHLPRVESRCGAVV